MTEAKKKKPQRKKKLSGLPLHKLPSHVDIVKHAQSFGPACIRALADEVANSTGAPRVSAANSLLERGYGKVGQPIELTVPGGVDLNVDISPEVAAMIRAVSGAVADD